MVNPFDTQNSLLLRVTEVSRYMRGQFERRIEHLGLTHPQWRALVHLSDKPGMNQAELSERLGVAPISAARLLDRMQHAGWVERRPDPNDRRSVSLFVCDDAEPVLAEIEKHAKLTRGVALDGLTEKDRKQLYDLLGRVKANLVADDRARAPKNKTRKA